MKDELKVKKTIYKGMGKINGICTIWDWCPKKNKYLKRHQGNRYYAYKKISGIQKAKSFESLEQARRWRDSASFYDSDSDSDSKTVTFSNIVRAFFEHKKAELEPSTCLSYESKCKHLKFFYDLPMNQVTPGAIDAWLLQVKTADYLRLQHKTRVSYRQELTVLRLILIYYSEYHCDSFQLPLKQRHLRDSVVDHKKYKESKDRGLTRFIPRADINKWLEALNERTEGRPERAVFASLGLFQTLTGCRIGECCSLYWSDIDFEGGFISVSKTVQWSRKKGIKTRISENTKTGDSRVIPLTAQLRSLLTYVQKLTSRRLGLVFSRDGFSPVSYRSIQYHYNKAFEATGLKWTSTHILRHSFATDFLAKTSACPVNREALQKILGHRNASMTEHYAKISLGTVEDGMRAYEESFKSDTVVSLKDYSEAKNTEPLVQAGKPNKT